MLRLKSYLAQTTLFTAAVAACTAFAAEEMAPEETEFWEPVPAKVFPGYHQQAPSDAIVLFDGTSLDAWEGDDGPAQWDVAEGRVTVAPGTGGITTKQGFGSCQLHIEWRSPFEPEKSGQNSGNSGVFLMGRYEIQVLDNYTNTTYVNGQAGSVYKQHVPLVNASLPTGEWQSYDIIFNAPVFSDDGSLEKPAYFTVLHNGVLVQNHVEVQGDTVWKGMPSYEAHPEKLPISLQDHGSPVSYRNIWIREL